MENNIMTYKQQLLDPISTICKIISLNFLKKCTKISIIDNILLIDKPTYYQGILRYYYGHDREEIGELFIVVVRIIKWYILPLNNILFDSDNVELSIDKITENIKKDSNIFIYELFPHENIVENLITLNKMIRRMLGYTLLGFSKLQYTYNNGNVVLTIQYYINLIKDSLNNKFTNELLPKCVLDGSNNKKNFLDYGKIMKLWDYNKIKIICDMFDNCFKTIHEINEPHDIKIKMIDGNLLTINNILDLIDGQFKILLKHNFSG
jgi:hypothetical protein